MEKFDTPGSRTEAVLQNLLGADNPLESPKSRNVIYKFYMIGLPVSCS